MLKFARDHVNTNLTEGYFYIFILGLIFDNFDQKVKKKWFFAKKDIPRVLY